LAGLFLIYAFIVLFCIKELKTLGDIFPIFGGLIFLILAIRAFVLLFQYYDYQVLISDTGISMTNGGRTNTIPWEKIENLWRKEMRYSVYLIPVINIRVLRIEDTNGQVYKFTGIIKKFEDLRNTIVTKFINTKFKDCQIRLEKGETLTFGDISLTSKKISVKEKSAYWQELGGVHLWQGTTYLKRAGGGKGDHMFNTNNWAQISFTENWKIPNRDLMVALIGYNIEKNANSIMPVEVVAPAERGRIHDKIFSQERITGLIFLAFGVLVAWFGAISPIIDALNQKSIIFYHTELLILTPVLFIFGLLYAILGANLGKIFYGRRMIFLLIFIFISGILFWLGFDRILSGLGYD
jgi:hypothetical protein